MPIRTAIAVWFVSLIGTAFVCGCNGSPSSATAASVARPPPVSGTPAAPLPPSGRFDKFFFGVCYYPEQWPKEYWPRDAQRMREAGVNVVRLGEFAWDRMEPKEGTFDFDWLDEVIDVLAEEGIDVILGTPTATPPKWLTQKYRDVLHVHDGGRAADDQSRRHYCYSSERYRALCRRIVAAMADHYRDHPRVIGWQVDNEMNNENKACFSDACRSGFRGWLRDKYGTLAALNERWGTAFWSQTYTDWNQINLPGSTIAHHNPALVLDHRRFISDSATAFLEQQVAIIRQRRPRDFIAHNGVFRGLNYYRFAQSLDVYAQDSYPTFLEEPRFPTAALLTAARSFAGRMMIMEELTGSAGQTYLLRTPAPGQMKFWAMQTVAHGADGVVHFRWRSARRGAEQYWAGVLDHDDVPRARYAEFAAEGKDLAKIGPQILGSEVRSDIAVINDYEAEWAYEHQYFTDEVNPDVGVHMRADMVELFRAASRQGYNVDFVPPTANLSKYKLVLAPKLLMVDEAIADRFRRFVEGGGTLIVGAHSGVKDRDNAMTDRTPPGLLADLFGVEVEAFQCYQPPSQEKNGLHFDDGRRVPVYVFADVLKPKHPDGAKVIATWGADLAPDKAACTERTVGRGRAVYYGSFLNFAAADYLLRRYAGRDNLRPLLPDMPESLEVTRRTSKSGTEFYFLLNHGDVPASVNLDDQFVDLLSDAAVSGAVTIPPFEYRVLRKASGAHSVP